EVPFVEKLVQFGIRNYAEEEWRYVCNSNYRVITYLDQKVKERMFEGELWRSITDELIQHLPEKIYLSFDIDGLDPKLCPHTGTPVPGGYDMEQILYIVKRMIAQGKQLIGFDLVEVGTGEDCVDANVGAILLWRLCNLLIKSNCT
ncbi:MAG: arginase family protein, partial [Bacteroidota bacterium]|nr:arginase family protein [Bacteroidota bacterium]